MLGRVGSILVAALLLFVAVSSPLAQAASYGYKDSYGKRGVWYSSGSRVSYQNSEQANESGVNVYVNNGVFEASAANTVHQSYARGTYSTRCGWNNKNWSADYQTPITCWLNY